MRVDNFGRQSLRFCPSITTIFENDRFLRLEGYVVKTVTLLDALDHPNDLSVFYCENSHYHFIIFFKPFNFPNGI